MAEATLQILKGHTSAVHSVAFSPHSKLIASASFDWTVRLWNIPTGDLNAELEGHANLVASVAFSPDGDSIVTGSHDNTVRTWSVATKQLVKTLKGHSKDVNSVAWSPNGDVIASGSSDETVILWDAISGSVKKKLKVHTNIVLSVSFSPNGKKLASAGWDKTVIIYNVNSGAALITLVQSSVVLSVCFSHDAQFVVTGCGDNIVRMFNANNGRDVKRFEGHTSLVNSVACSFDGSMIESGSDDNSVRLWDVASTKQLQKLDTNQVRSVAFSRDGKFIASGSVDKIVCLWNVPLLLREEHHLVEMRERNEPLVEQQEMADRDQAESLVSEPSNVSKIVHERSDDEDDKTFSKKARTENGEDDEVAKKVQQQTVYLAESDASSTMRPTVTDVPPYETFDRTVSIGSATSISSTAAFTTSSARSSAADMEITGPQIEESSHEIAAPGLRKANSTSWIFDWFAVIAAFTSPFKSIFNTTPPVAQAEPTPGESTLPSSGRNLFGSSQPQNKTGLELHEIPRHELTKDTKLSEGKFGIVWRGTFTDIPVAIKEPKLYDADLNAAKQLADLIEEAKLMTRISAHPNVLHCYGVSRVGKDNYLLVTEWCNLGSLESFLQTYPGTPAVDRRRFSRQVARGLNHLGKHNVAHRDVAARNVLLHDQEGVIVAKVCDFGLSRQRGGEYYTLTGQHFVSPETAPEVFNTGKHSSRSDVWSFGVLLWEVESLCATRAKLDTQSFPPLHKPAQASDNMYEIMLKCWAKEPHQRPSFGELIDMLA